METDDDFLNETLCIINHFEPELYKKIPLKLIEFLESKRNDSYETNIDFSKNINSQKINRKTRAMLAIIYRDYICNTTERNELVKQDTEYFEEKYKIDFGKNLELANNIKTMETRENELNSKMQMTEYKENVLKKFINFIKRIFKRKLEK